MATLSTFHCGLGRMDFLGLRSTPRGGMEIVYDDGAARRMIWRVSAPDTPQERIGDALRIALTRRRMVPALHSELEKRSIAVETIAG